MQRVGLVAPLPPQIGGVATVAEWLLEHEDEIGVRYETFDLVRPRPEVGGRWSVDAALHQSRVLAAFVRWLRHGPDVVHFCVSCTTTGLLRDVVLLAAARAAGKHAVVHVHGSDLAGAVRSPVRRRALRTAARLSDERVALSPALARILASIGITATWIPNPIRLMPVEAPHRNGTGPLRLLLVGRYGERKGIFELVEALAEARQSVDVSLAIVGSEEHEGEERRLVERVGALAISDAVRLVPPVPREGLDRWLREADVICLPSREEGVPMALLEGMAYGLPVLATPVGGIPDLVDDGQSGFLVPPGDTAALVDGIRTLADSDLRGRMAKAARDRALRFAPPDAIVACWREVYASVSRWRPELRNDQSRGDESS